MKTLLLCLTVLTLTAFSCSKEADELSLRTSDPAPVLAVTVPEKVFTVGESIAITVSFQVRNGCGQFSSFETSSDGNVLTIHVIPYYAEGFCTQALETRQTTYTFQPQQAGTYTLKFWAGENDYIFETVVVK